MGFFDIDKEQLKGGELPSYKEMKDEAVLLKQFKKNNYSLMIVKVLRDGVEQSSIRSKGYNYNTGEYLIETIGKTLGYVVENVGTKKISIPISNNTVRLDTLEIKPKERAVLSLETLNTCFKYYYNQIESEYYTDKSEKYNDKIGELVRNKIEYALGVKNYKFIRSSSKINHYFRYIIGEYKAKDEFLIPDKDKTICGKPYSFWFKENKQETKNKSEGIKKKPERVGKIQDKIKTSNENYSVIVTKILIQNGERVAFGIKNIGEDITVNAQTLRNSEETILNKEQILWLDNCKIKFINATVYRNSNGTVVVKALQNRNIPEIHI